MDGKAASVSGGSTVALGWLTGVASWGTGYGCGSCPDIFDWKMEL